MREILKISYPPSPAGKKAWLKEYGTNAYWAGKHWAKRKEDAKFWHTITIGAMNRAGVRKKPFEKPVVITFLWDDNLDIDNHSIMGKMIVDALKTRLINDDSKKWVKGVEHFYHGGGCIKVIVQEVESHED